MVGADDVPVYRAEGLGTDYSRTASYKNASNEDCPIGVFIARLGCVCKTSWYLILGHYYAKR